MEKSDLTVKFIGSYVIHGKLLSLIYCIYSEDTMQYLEYMRNILREQATVIIQALVRMYLCRKAFTRKKRNQEMRSQSRRNLINNSKAKIRQNSLRLD